MHDTGWQQEIGTLLKHCRIGFADFRLFALKRRASTG